jgi:cytochrome c-type biogenesis protein CcmH/NrfG
MSARRSTRTRQTQRVEETPPARLADDDFAEVLKRRARRLASQDEPRKAALALRELAARTDAAAHWVLLGDMLRRARRQSEALAALREGLWRHRQAGSEARARTVAALMLALDPTDSQAQRVRSGGVTHRAA